MIVSRSTRELHPKVAELCRRWLEDVRAADLDVLITATYRDHEAQQMLYDQGRISPGRVVTNAGPGDSYHNWRLAFDFVPTVYGKPVWNDKDPIWTRCGVIAEALGLEWGGRWKFRDLPHIQYTFGLSIDALKSGKKPPE